MTVCRANHLTANHLRNDICDDALNEIAAFESFISDFVTRQSDASASSGGGGGNNHATSGLRDPLRGDRAGKHQASPKSSTSGSMVSGCGSSTQWVPSSNLAP